MITKETFALTLNEFADGIKNDFRSPIRANPEDQLKRPVATLLESVFHNEINTRTEAQVEGLGARPDLGVARNRLLCGYVELKAPNIPVRRLTGENKIQFAKFKALPNLIYTNGNEWISYRSGEQHGNIILLNGDITEIGSRAITNEIVEQLYRLFIDFLSWQPQVPRSPKALADTLAPLCRFLREDVEIATKKEDATIHYLFNDWKRLFFPDADINKFADAYAQTITYALLLARLSGSSLASIEDAARSIDADHSLLGQVLRFLGQQNAIREMQTGMYGVLVP